MRAREVATCLDAPQTQEATMMIKKSSARQGFVRVCFELPSCLWADHVYLVGDFNKWDCRCTPLRQDRDGIWRVELDLPSGARFEFRYLVDNRWLTDNHSDGVVTNPYGAQNSVVETTLPVKGWPVAPVDSPPFRTVGRRHSHLTTMD
jgi:hypothetical protein